MHNAERRRLALVTNVSVCAVPSWFETLRVVTTVGTYSLQLDARNSNSSKLDRRSLTKNYLRPDHQRNFWAGRIDTEALTSNDAHHTNDSTGQQLACTREAPSSSAAGPNNMIVHQHDLRTNLDDGCNNETNMTNAKRCLEPQGHTKLGHSWKENILHAQIIDTHNEHQKHIQ